MPIWMWPIVSGKSSFLIWNTKSHKFRCREMWRESASMRVCMWWRGERRRTRTCHFKSQPIHAPTQPWRQKQIRYIVHDTKDVFELKWKWKHRNLFVIRMRYGFLFDTSDELDDDFSWFIRPDIVNKCM